MTNNLRQIWSTARSQWESSRSGWSDEARTKFDNQIIIPLEQHGQAIGQAVDKLDQFMRLAYEGLRTNEQQIKKIEQQLRYLG